MSNPRLSDIITAIPALNENGSNWSIFKIRFHLALFPYDLFHHYVPDLKHPKPVNPVSRLSSDPKGILTEAETKLKDKFDNELAKWERDEEIAQYILSRVIPDSMLWKIYSETKPVSQMWTMLTTEFEQKTALVQADLRAKFHSYRCPEKGDIRTHLSRLRQMHQELQNIGVTIDDRDYVAIIMQSLPSTYADFVANIAAAAQLVMVDLTVDKLQHQLEQEFDRRKTHQVRQNHSNNQQSSQSKDVAYAANTNQNSKKSRKSKGELRCWNCDDVGHIRSKCPKPRVEKGKAQESANAVEDSEVVGTWMAIPEDWDEEIEADDDIWLTEVADEDVVFADDEVDVPAIISHTALAVIEEVEAEVAQAAAEGEDKRRRTDLYDSGTTHHMSPERDRFITYSEIPPKPIRAASQARFYATGIGEMLVDVPNGDSMSMMRLTGVLYAPTMSVTLISIGCIDAAGGFCTFGGGKLVITDPNGKKVGQIPRQNWLYTIEHSPDERAHHASDTLTLEQLHRAMGHISYNTVKTLVKDNLVTGIRVDLSSPTPFCEACVYGKQHKVPVPKERQGPRSKDFGDQIHSDLWGPAPIATFGKKQYYISFTDDATRLTNLYLLREKSEAFEAYQQYHAWVKTQMKVPIKILHSDNGGEYLSKPFIKYLKDSGTEHRLTVNDTPAQNGVAERLNGVLMQKVRAMMHGTGLPKGMWGEALMHAVWLKNRTSTKALQGITPFEAKEKVQPDLSRLRIFGCKAWVLKVRSKLDGRAEEGRWVGIDPNTEDGHRIYWPARRRVRVERNVVFDNSEIISLPEISDLVDAPKNDTPTPNQPLNVIETHVPDAASTPPTPQPTPQQAPTPETRPSRTKQPSRYVRQLMSGAGTVNGLPKGPALPKGMQFAKLAEEIDEDEFFSDDEDRENQSPLTDEVAMVIAMSDFEGIEPRDIKEARKRPDWERWKEAMEEEMRRLKANDTWEVINKPKAANVVGSKWVYRIKKNAAGQIDKYRARLVAQGFSQVPGVDYFDTFAPVAKTTSIRVVLTLAAHYGWPVHQMDVKSAYLNGVLDEKEVIYLRQPPGFVIAGSEHLVLKLNKALYGLKQSGR